MYNDNDINKHLIKLITITVIKIVYNWPSHYLAYCFSNVSKVNNWHYIRPNTCSAHSNYSSVGEITILHFWDRGVYSRKGKKLNIRGNSSAICLWLLLMPLTKIMLDLLAICWHCSCNEPYTFLTQFSWVLLVGYENVFQSYKWYHLTLTGVHFGCKQLGKTTLPN